jgi:AcrR family transcriptional regulator
MSGQNRPWPRLAAATWHFSATGRRGIDGRTELATQSLSLELRAKRSEMMVSELEAFALRLFEERGSSEVTVEQIASEAHISARTFYRYFPAKEDVLQVRIDRRSQALRVALAARPADEPPLHSLRLALEQELSSEDAALLRRWIAVVAATPSVLRAVIGGIQLKSQPVIADFFGSRLGLPSDALVPIMLAAAVGGVIQAANTHWFFNGGSLATTISESLEVLERGIGTDLETWPAGPRPKIPSRDKPVD